MILGNRNSLEKACPSATLSTTNPKRNGPRLNPAFNSEKNILSYGYSHSLEAYGSKIERL